MTDAPSPRCSSGSVEALREGLDEARRDMKKLARELQQGLPKRNAAERLEAMSGAAGAALRGVAQGRQESEFTLQTPMTDFSRLRAEEALQRQTGVKSVIDALARDLVAAGESEYAQAEKVPVARPVAFRVPRVVDDKISKTEFRLFDDEDEARRAACDIGTDYDGLYLVADRHAAFFAQPDPVQSASPDLPTLDEYRNNLIEECAKVAEFRFAGTNLSNIGGLVAESIRALAIPSTEGK